MFFSVFLCVVTDRQCVDCSSTTVPWCICAEIKLLSTLSNRHRLQPPRHHSGCYVIYFIYPGTTGAAQDTFLTSFLAAIFPSFPQTPSPSASLYPGGESCRSCYLYFLVVTQYFFKWCYMACCCTLFCTNVFLIGFSYEMPEILRKSVVSNDHRSQSETQQFGKSSHDRIIIMKYWKRWLRFGYQHSSAAKWRASNVLCVNSNLLSHGSVIEAWRK